MDDVGLGDDPLLDRARSLVQAAHISAVGMFTPLHRSFPILREVDAEQWDYVLTVAGVFIAASSLNNRRIADSQSEALLKIICESLSSWKPDGIHGFENCKQLFEHVFDRLTAAGHEPQFVTADAVGTWIVWNILDHAPQSDEEYRLVRTTGTMVTSAFVDWWSTAELQNVNVCALQCARGAIAAVLTDPVWNAFGYRGRPQPPKGINILFGQSKWECAETLTRELWAACLCRVFLWARGSSALSLRSQLLARVLEVATDGSPDYPIWRVILGYRSRKLALQRFIHACADYYKERDGQCDIVFLKRCVSCLFCRMPRSWPAGASWLFTSPESPLLSIDGILQSIGNSDDGESSLVIEDSIFLELASDLVTGSARKWCLGDFEA